MDDLLLIWICDKEDPITQELMDEDVKMIVDTKRENPVYNKDLEIKQEHDDRGAPCLGTLIFEQDGILYIRFLNKNETSLTEKIPRQTTIRLQHMKSFSQLINRGCAPIL